MKRFFALLLSILFLLTGCGKAAEEGGTAGGGSASAGQISLAATDEEMFTDRDQTASIDESAVAVQLTGSSAECSSDEVAVSGSTVTVKGGGTYAFSGSLSGQIVVDAEGQKPRLIFTGVSLTNETDAPLYIKEADKVVVTLAGENTLTAGETFTADGETNIDGAVFSKQDLTFNGEGTLTVSSPAGHGIVCKDDLVFTGGSYNITCASHGLDANDSVRISAAALTVAAGKDGIHAENSDDTSLGFIYISGGTFAITAEGDGISAGSTLQIEGGEFDLTCGGGSENGQQQSSENWGGFGGGMGGGMDRPGGGMGGGMRPTEVSTDTASAADDSSTSMKGIKSGGDMQINGGTFTMNTADDGLHSNASMAVRGGEFTVATGDDGLHAEETLEVSAGKITISESYEGLEALDIIVSGGQITLTASDDGLNAAGGTDSSGTTGGRDGMFGGGMGGPGGGMSAGNGSILISGGMLDITASGDGIDANGTLEISGGFTTVCGPTQGDTATLDYDTSAVISGGTFIGTGASGMAQTFSDSTQGLISVSVGNQSAGTAIRLLDQAGNTLAEHTPDLSYAVVIISTPEMKTGETYTLYVGENSAEMTAA